ncbi:MAG TPA: acetate/propionate family kinase [Solirubrobacteraceae bacterium]|nr:acetate/propionate family kinase [Solirubrobacteraceae bacterium]
MRVLVVNAGSSTLKLTLLDEQDTTLASQELSAARAQVDPDLLRAALNSPLREADAVGHRIVHGGERFREAVRIDTYVEAAMRELCDLAPLHQLGSLAALDAVTEMLPGLPAVACFDTAFHSTLLMAAATYALPAAWREQWGLRRYGFHGLSHAWVARRTPQLLKRDPVGLRVVSCHLGAGASLCAIRGGHSLDTTMGFTPLEGLVMATRSGSVDPGMLLWLAERSELTLAELADALEHDSGLFGLAGSADMREIVSHVENGDERARLALDVYTHRLRAGIAAMAATLGGLDVLVFTGGIGEHSHEVRSRAAAGLGFLGLSLDQTRNRQAAGDAEISAAGATVRSLVLTAREDLEIARQVRTVLEGRSSLQA